MTASLESIFDSLGVPALTESRGVMYSISPVPEADGYFIGKDTSSRACLLIKAADRSQRPHSPIRLEQIEVQFEVLSLVKTRKTAREDTFTVVRCRSMTPELVSYFFSVCDLVIRLLGPNPSRIEVASAINRLAAIFQRLQTPASRTVLGLFGELFLIRYSGSPARSITAWRQEDVSRFDFSDGDIRLDVKASTGRTRIHSFSYEQCNPPSGTAAILVSLLTEPSGSGKTLQKLIEEIDSLVSRSMELVLKLHTTVAATLGSSMQEALTVRFDEQLAASSLQLFDLTSIPAIRGNLPLGVSDVHFRADLSGSGPASFSSLCTAHPTLEALLPAFLDR